MSADSQSTPFSELSRLPWRSVLLAAFALGAYLTLGAAPGDWVYDRVAIAGGEWWRLLTAHWLHSDASHAGWNIGALLLLGLLFEPVLRWKLAFSLLVGTAAVDAWLWWGEPALARYCGLSGLLNCLLVTGLVQLWYRTHHPLVWLTGIVAAAKIGLEILAGHSLVTNTYWPSIPSAHAAGFLAGIVTGFLLARAWPGFTANRLDALSRPRQEGKASTQRTHDHHKNNHQLQ